MAKEVTYILKTPSTCNSSGCGTGEVLIGTESLGNTEAGYLDSLQLFNLDDNDRGFTLYFLRSESTVGAESAAFAPSDANVDEILTAVTFTSGAYIDCVNSLMQIKTEAAGDAGMGVWLQGASPSESQLVYIAGVTTTTGGWSSGGLKFRIGIRSPF